MDKRIKCGIGVGAVILLIVFSTAMSGCIGNDRAPAAPPKSDSGVSKVTVKVTQNVKDSDGIMKTSEQYLIGKKLTLDNRVGIQKYVYIIGMNGQVNQKYVIQYKSVSSGKRLTPRTVAAGVAGSGGGWSVFGIPIVIGGESQRSPEVPEDDGTFGDSIPYQYFFTTAGNYVKLIPLDSFLMVEADMPLTPQELVFTNNVYKGKGTL